MERHGCRNRPEIATLLALLFILFYTMISLWMKIERTPPPISTAIPVAALGTSVSPETTTISPIVTPVPSATPSGELLKPFSQAWWSRFIEAFSEPGLWVEVIGGVVLGALTAILVRLIPPLLSLTLRFWKFVYENVPDRIRSHFNTVSTAVKHWLELVRSPVIEASHTGEYLLEKVLPATGQVLTQVWLLIVAPIEAFWAKVKAPKWYKNKGVIDSGLIEVSLAVTAIIIALPALTLGGSVSGQQLVGLRLFHILSEAIPIGVSINFIDLYAKDKGSRSFHVLLSPIEDGPFFFLSWAILLAFMIIAAVIGIAW